MFLKILKNRGAGSATATANYLMGKDRDRDGAKVIKGDLELTTQIAESLDFKNKYTVGVLSFEESELDEQTKLEIMERFEQTCFAGLDRQQYNICWVEHSDKGRVELNFFIPNVELESGKRFQPYFDGTDRKLFDSWKNTINHEFGLSDPNDPAKKQALTVQSTLPADKKELQQAITDNLMAKVMVGKVSSRDDVVNEIKEMGLEIARLTPSAISIKDPTGGKNIRLKGEIYEQNFRFDESYQRQHSERIAEYRATSTSRYQADLAEYARQLEKRSKYHASRFERATSEQQQGFERNSDRTQETARQDIGGQSSPAGSTSTTDDTTTGADTAEQQRESTHDSQKPLVVGDFGISGGFGAGTDDLERDTSKEHHRPARRTSEHQTSSKSVTATSPSPSQSGSGAERRWDDLDRTQEPQESRIGQIDRRQTPNVTEVRKQHEQSILERVASNIEPATAEISTDESRKQRLDEVSRELKQREQIIISSSQSSDRHQRELESTAQAIERHQREFDSRKSTLDRLTQRLSDQIQRIREQFSRLAENVKKSASELTANNRINSIISDKQPPAPPPIEPPPAKNQLKIGKMWTIKELKDAGLNSRQAELVSNAQKKTQQFGSSRNGERLQAFQNQALQHIEQGTIDKHIKDLQDKDRGR